MCGSRLFNMLLMFLVVLVVVWNVGVEGSVVSDEEDIYKRLSSKPMLCESTGAKWSYDRRAKNGPSKWFKLSKCCGGSWQSPLNIITSRVYYGRKFAMSYIYTRREGRVQGYLYNNGHGPKVEFERKDTLILKGVPYSSGSNYVLAEMHYHAGNRPGTGSEHRVDGIGYRGEVHLVHYKEEYGSVAKAVTKPDGLAVIGVFIRQSSAPINLEMNQNIHDIAKLGQKIGSRITIAVDPWEFVPVSDTFYTYLGSLTKPPCSESVRWIVMADPITTSAKNMRVLENLPTAERVPIAEHTSTRPTFDMGSRTVEANFIPK